MKYIGSIVLSFEETGELSRIVPWKIDNVQEIFNELKEEGQPLSGMVYVSTCNRVEFIYTLNDPDSHSDFALALIEKLPPLEKGIRPSIMHARRSLLHLLRLAAGLESMVLGETEIRAQLKDAFENAKKNKMLDSRLNILFRNLFEEARNVRSSINMSNLPLSVATLATKYLYQHAESLHADGAFVVIGSGPMSRQAAEYLSKSRRSLILVNRTPEKLQAHADRIGARVFDFDTFVNHPEKLGPIAAVITATSRPDAFINEKLLNRILENNNGGDKKKESIAFVDMALPPDVDPALGKRGEVALISMESLKLELEKNKRKREEAAEEAEEFIEEALFRIEVNLIKGLSGPIITKIQKNIKNKSREHLNNLLEGRLSHLTKKDRRIIFTWAIQAHREMNRIHSHGLEVMLQNMYAENQSGTKKEIV